MGRPSLIVTGAGGFVAGSVLREALRDWEVYAVSRGPAIVESPNLHWRSLELEDQPGLEQLFATVQPAAVIHTAAMAGIDECEAQRDLAYAVNVAYTRRLAELTQECGGRFVFVSTDNVFDGVSGPYSEDSETGPVNYYGETKVLAEHAALGACGNTVAARVCLVMGFPVMGGGNSFLMRMLPALEAGEALGVPDNEIRSPIDVVTLGRALVELADHDHVGALHLSGSERINRLDLVRRIADTLGYPDADIQPFDPRDLPGRADRPAELILENALARRVLKTPMQDVAGALELMVADRPS
jgi:dTDP-4-dehydrorhamnose reductase